MRWVMSVFFLCGALHAAEKRVPTIDDLLNIHQAGSATISPDGEWVAYSVEEADFEHDSFVSQIWLTNGSGEIFQLTRGEYSATRFKWSPDGLWLGFRRRYESKDQVFAMRRAGGEPVRLTDAAEGISDFEWSTDGRSIAFVAQTPESAEMKRRQERYSEYTVVRRDYGFEQIWTCDVNEAMKEPCKGRQRTSGSKRSVLDIAWSPDSRTIAFSAAVNPDLVRRDTTDLFLLGLEDDSVTRLVSWSGPDRDPHWSPDGKEIVFSTSLGQGRYFPLLSRLAVVPFQGGEPRPITDQFDEDADFVAWRQDGIYFEALQRTASHLFRINSSSKAIERVSGPDDLLGDSFSLSADGKRVAFVAKSPTSLREVLHSSVNDFSAEPLTDFTRAVSELDLSRPEVIRWQSRDGTWIEGVLRKPAQFDPSVKHPLLCVIHGGPTGVDQPGLARTRYYPVDIWAARGALILSVNYRGSAGYGEDFRRLNVRNLGVGDSWDVLSGVEQLIKKGWVDPDRIGCMGWSQGGYISAFLTASSHEFAAISVGAGISDWATYYYNTDITPFTINYLGDDPISDPEIYVKTSPMSYLKQARTPTLIQHGELDRRVPIPNGYELRQGLEDLGIPVEMIVYKGFGHGINKPKSMRAVMSHNLEWFNHFIWGDPKPDFTELN